jgi:excisionase family DNA binding protein
MQLDRLLCAKEVARRLGVSRRTLWRRLLQREIPPPVVRSRGRRALWRESDISAYIAAMTPVEASAMDGSPAAPR